jgi:membrane protein implicated in regulation of membrane protease activity
MYSMLSAIVGLEKAFVICAVLGGGFFILRLIMMFMGFGHHDVGGGTTGVDGADSADAGVHHDSADSDISFKTLSIQGLTAFFMMFGLVGWAMLRESKQSATVSILVAFIAGVGTVWLIKKIFHVAGSLQSSGTINLTKAIGQEGTVYLTIHPGQIGKVQVIIQDQLKIMDARSDSAEDILTGQNIKVVRVTNNILIVEKK